MQAEMGEVHVAMYLIILVLTSVVCLHIVELTYSWAVGWAIFRVPLTRSHC